MVTETLEKQTNKGQMEVLLARVVKGNQVLFNLWQKAKAAADDQSEYGRIMSLIDEKYQLLDTLCRALMALSYRKCLYPVSEHRPCFTPGGWYCFTCPKCSLPEPVTPIGDSLPQSGESHSQLSPRLL